MKRRWGLCSAGMAVLLCLLPLGASAAPKISVPTLRQELGTLMAGETAEVEFAFTNDGTDPLKYRRAGSFRVVEVQTDSPALKAEVSAIDTAAADGRSSFYGISVHYLGGWQKGKVTGKILVRIDDPAVPKLEIPYEATVE